MTKRKAFATAAVVALAFVCAPVAFASTLDCSRQVAGVGLLERVAEALGWRSQQRMWPTAVFQTGRRGMRQLLVYVRTKDLDLRPIPARYRNYFVPFAFTMDGLEQTAQAGGLRVIRQDADGTTVRLDWEARTKFPNAAVDAAQRLDLAESLERIHAHARDALYPSLWRTLFEDHVSIPLRVRMDFRLVPDERGIEKVEAVVVEVAVPAMGEAKDSWLLVAKGTDR